MGGVVRENVVNTGHFSACSESLPALMDYIALRSSSLGLPRVTSLRLQLVAEELFTNTFRHGQPCDTPSVTVRIESAGADIEFTYEDCEAPCNPLAHLDLAPLHLPLAQRPVGGLGVVLIDAFAEKVQYERVQERNRVTVWLRCNPEENP
jgi:serine/threonine-protein kinase RsbW